MSSSEAVHILAIPKIHCTPSLLIALDITDTEAVVELSRRVNMDRTVALIAPLQYWLGQRVQIDCREVSPDEVEHTQRREEDEEREFQPETQEA